MAENSYPWDGNSVGDAGPYSFDDWTDMWRKVFTYDRTVEAVLTDYLNELEVTGAVSPVAIDTGGALVDGTFYENNSSLNVVVPSPAGATRIDRIVLRKSWANQTVRITRIAGAEGGGAPAITQNDGVTWDVSIAQVSIEVGGAITITDEREYLHFNTAVQTGMIDAEAVTTEKIANLAVTAAKLAADAVETAKIKDEAVTADKIETGSSDGDVAAVTGAALAFLALLSTGGGGLIDYGYQYADGTVSTSNAGPVQLAGGPAVSVVPQNFGICIIMMTLDLYPSAGSNAYAWLVRDEGNANGHAEFQYGNNGILNMYTDMNSFSTSTKIVFQSGLVAGDTYDFEMEYGTDGTGQFRRRTLLVLAL